MSELPLHPSHDALSALPGDVINFINPDDCFYEDSGIVKSVLWQPAPKGGKIYCYELLDGSIVPNDNVTKVIKI